MTVIVLLVLACLFLILAPSWGLPLAVLALLLLFAPVATLAVLGIVLGIWAAIAFFLHVIDHGD